MILLPLSSGPRKGLSFRSERVPPRRIGDSHREWAKKRTKINKELQNPCLRPGYKDRFLNTLSRIIRLLQNWISLFFYSAFFRYVNKVLVCIGILGRSQ